MEQPKKPTGGAFGCYLDANRAAFLKECAGKAASEAVKIASVRWKALPESEKQQVWEKKYQEKKAAFTEKMEAFLAAGGEKKASAKKMRKDALKFKKGKKKKVDANAPKKPAGGAYGCYLAKNRAAFMAQCKNSITEVTKLASSQWAKLGASDRKPFEEEYTSKKRTYEEAMKAYVPPAVEEGEDDEEEVPAKGRRGSKREKDPNAPKKPAGGAYGCYVAANRASFQAECKGKPVSAVSKLASSRWAKLSASDKKPFEEDYAKKKLAYEAAKKAYVPKIVIAEEDNKVFVKDAKPIAKKAKTAASSEPEAKTEAKKAKTEAKKAKTEAKKAKTEAKKAKTEAKKAAGAKGKDKGKATSKGVVLDAEIAEKAAKAGMKDTLIKLASREDVIESGKTQKQMLKALEANRGLLHAAKRYLLGEG